MDLRSCVEWRASLTRFGALRQPSVRFPGLTLSVGQEYDALHRQEKSALDHRGTGGSFARGRSLGPIRAQGARAARQDFLCQLMRERRAAELRARGRAAALVLV